MTDHNSMESRIKGLEGRMDRAEVQLGEHDEALRGSYGGQTGLLARVEQLVDLSTRNATQLDSLRLDRAKVAGIVAVVTLALGLVYKFFLK